MKLKFLTLFAFVFSWCLTLSAQMVSVKGTVTDEGKVPLPGVSVLIKNTTRGVATDFDGKYEIKANRGDVLVFSYLGFVTQEKTVGAGSSQTINVLLVEEAEQLGEVVVTALGIKREKKSLGYALQEVKGDALVEAKETNLANAFSGKVAGLQIVRGSNGPAASSKIVLRGNNSLTGDNQPLIVVDGVPMDNFTGASNNDFWNPTNDMGNGLGDLNPNDIESMSVLKGPAAAALYGSRAGNGVILITTKSGKAREGLGITYSSSIGFENVFMKPDVQNVFGQGADGNYDPLSASSWGPKIEGQMVEDWKGARIPLRVHDNVEGFLNTGVDVQHSVSFQQQVTNGTSIYSSLTHVDNQSSIPGATLERLNLISRAISRFGKDEKWTTDFKVQYINSKVKNRPIGGQRDINVFNSMLNLPVTVDVTEFSRAIDDYGNHIWYNTSGLNPFWLAKYNTNEDSRDRFMMNGSVKYQFTDWLNAEVKGGTDLYTTNVENKTYGKSSLTTTGRYSLGKDTFNETNLSFLFSAQKNDLFGKVGMAATFGGNLMKRHSSGLSIDAGELEVPNLFVVTNSKGNPGVSQHYRMHKINSFYGTYQINYDQYAFLDITGRNDWSSTLSKENRSFFYPSVSASLVFSEMLEKEYDIKPEWFNYGKIRASYAVVGNDMGPYQLYNFYKIGKDPNGNTTATTNDVLYNSNVKNELIKSWEIGVDAKFFNNRLGIDLSFYKSNATNQLLNIPLNSMSGYKAMKVNAGDIENKGFELMLTGQPIRGEKFSWDMVVNASKNINTVNSLVEGSEPVTQYGLGTFDNIQILAMSGERYGVIYGTKFVRVEDIASPHYGRIIVDEHGAPKGTGEKYILGNQQPDFLLGFTNTFTYKNLSLSILVDGRFGGKIFSGTNHGLKTSGRSAATVVNGERADIVYNGVVESGNGYQENTKAISPQDFWVNRMASRTGNLGITEENLFDATNIRIRNLQLNYRLPDDWVKGLGAQSAKVGMSVNNVVMLKSYLNGVDPESVFATGTNAVGYENFSSPTMRSYYFNVTVSF
ncbi:TonB-linked outer membrane protein, SusC/RagA family [Capnocytophaga canis]|uniref:SusC/RagA family TonB-linked outer membrane protein n=1 Tax=Capnocytophaga canis TaxID=1848903 RepID=UPI0005898E30|nr:SusC/RagA family TonB-linked outer membrane protein [Capnocytophaga canis]CEN42898.1 TonB-linked outer membrane protein, SusC/RagA family [Capnocytophaga canis]